MLRANAVIVHSLDTLNLGVLCMQRLSPSLLSMRQPDRPMQELQPARKTYQPQLEEVRAPWQSSETSPTSPYS